MADTNKTVTISADYFVKLHQMATQSEMSVETINALAKERDDLKAKLESEYADKFKVIKELNEVRELNRKCCDENDELKAKLDKKISVELVDCQAKTWYENLIAARKCINELSDFILPNEKYAESHFKPLGDIIRSYREKKEAK